MNRKTMRYAACCMLLLAAAFMLFALNNPQCSFPWSNDMTYILYGVYLAVMAALFAASCCKKK